MKKIHIISPYIEGLATIKSYLAELGFDITDFKTPEMAIQYSEVPDLIILFTTQDPADFERDIECLRASSTHARIPRICILPYNFPGEAGYSDIAGGQAAFQMPVDKLRFLSAVSLFLKRAQRRVFRILVTLQPEGANIRYSGISMDFSESGMAFECTSDFAKSDRLAVSFVNPRSKKRFLLKSEVVRKAQSPTGDKTFYGIKFLAMTEEEKKDLTGFITGEA